MPGGHDPKCPLDPPVDIDRRLTMCLYVGSYAKSELDRRSEKPSPEEEDAAAADIDDYDYVPHFQRVSISGEDTSGVRTHFEGISYSGFGGYLTLPPGPTQSLSSRRAH